MQKSADLGSVLCDASALSSQNSRISVNILLYCKYTCCVTEKEIFYTKISVAGLPTHPILAEVSRNLTTNYDRTIQ